MTSPNDYSDYAELYAAIAASLKESYPSVTAERVAIVHGAMRDGAQDSSYGVVNRFIRDALNEAFSKQATPMVGEINAGEVIIIDGDVHGGITL